MRFSTLIKVLQTGDAGLRWSQPGLDPWLEGAASLEQASAAQLSFLEKGNALTAALGASGVGALLLPDQPDLIDLASQRGIALRSSRIRVWPLLKPSISCIPAAGPWRRFTLRR